MSFPERDRFWQDAFYFIKQHLKSLDHLLAPIEFKEKLDNVFDYSLSQIANPNKLQWIVVHKGMLAEIDNDFLDSITKNFSPVFVNEVFVIFSSYLSLKKIAKNSVHLQSFWEKMQFKHQETNSSIPPQNSPENIKSYQDLSVEEIKEQMNQRYANKEAYNTIYLWDIVRFKELNRQVMEHISPTKDKTILEIGCGMSASVAFISDYQKYIGIDLSDVAISQANSQFKTRKNCQFISMDAMNLEFEDCNFDIVIAKEIIEHLPNPEKALAEAYRVLKPNGILVVTSPNRDSLHLRVNRMLGNPDFKCSFDHIKEFTFAEASAIIAKMGFVISKTSGVFCQPYWGIPVIDSQVRSLTDKNPQMIEMLRDLGNRIGAEYAFCFVISGYKSV